jgi:hypothetical protein
LYFVEAPTNLYRDIWEFCDANEVACIIKEDFLIDKYKEKYKDKNVINIFGNFDYIKKEVENYLSLRNII